MTTVGEHHKFKTTTLNFDTFGGISKLLYERHLIWATNSCYNINSNLPRLMIRRLAKTACIAWAICVTWTVRHAGQLTVALGPIL